jgi:hypothetical protein
MTHQTLPDQFYNAFCGFAIIGFLFVPRYWHLMMLMCSKKFYSPTDSQNKRYVLSILAASSSIAFIVYMLVNYGLHLTLVGMNEAYRVDSWYFGGPLWAAFVLQLATAISLPFFLLWFYKHPVDRRLSGAF